MRFTQTDSQDGGGDGRNAGRGHSVRLIATIATCLVLALLFLPGAQTAPSGMADGTVLGNLFEGYGSANWSWGRYPGYKFAISFVAQHNKRLSYCWICWKTAAGYANGNNGSWTFELQADDPRTHQPTGQVLARLANIRQPPEGYFLLNFSSVPLVAGQHYHLVMANVDPRPGENWSSPNTILSTSDRVWNGTGVLSFDGKRWQPWGSVDNPCQPGAGGRAAYCLQFDDGTVEGMPYYSATMLPLYADHAVGEQFTWRKADIRISQLGFPVFCTGKPPAALSYTLETAAGKRVATGVLVTPAAVQTKPSWQRVSLPKPIPLRNGVTYRLYLSAPACHEEANGYRIYVPYSSEKVPGWPDLTWNGRNAICVTDTRTEGWKPLSIPADLTFSMVSAK